MAYIEVPEGLPGIRGLLAFRPDTAKPIGELTDILLHAPNSLSPGERELIAGYVSSLNDCAYCRDSHLAIAACHLHGADIPASVIRDPEGAGVSPKLKALLAVAGRVALGGRSVRPSDIARARDEGASDMEIHDTVLIAAVFCMFNRYVDGLGTFTPTDPEGYRERAAYVAAHGYAAVLAAQVQAPAASQ
jgi:uncharacterized peroxidase-related enzyme